MRTVCSGALRPTRDRWQARVCSTSIRSSTLGQARHVTALLSPLRAADRRVVVPHVYVVTYGHSNKRSIAVQAYRVRTSATASSPGNPAAEPRSLFPAVSLHARYPASIANVQPRGRVSATPGSSRPESSRPSKLRGTNGGSNTTVNSGSSSSRGSRRRFKRKHKISQEAACVAAEVIAADNVSQQQCNPAAIPVGVSRGRPPPDRPKPRTSHMRGLIITNEPSPQQQSQPNDLHLQPPPDGADMIEGAVNRHCGLKRWPASV